MSTKIRETAKKNLLTKCEEERKTLQTNLDAKQIEIAEKELEAEIYERAEIDEAFQAAKAHVQSLIEDSIALTQKAVELDKLIEAAKEVK